MTSLVIFYLASCVVIGGGLTVVMSRNIVYAAFGLIASLSGVAGIFSASLELTKEGLIEIMQKKNFDKVLIKNKNE